MKRCAWCLNDPLYIAYHDLEWGSPVYEDEKLFEMLVLEGMQAGLNWLTILKRRENYRLLFDNFDPKKIAKYSDAKLEKLLTDPRIIRNRLKVFSFRTNARAFLVTQKEFGSFHEYIWQFVGGEPLKNAWKELQEIPSKTENSDRMSKDLKKRGFSFVGSTICYAYMQAVGMVNDHLKSCYRYKEVNNKMSTKL